MIRILIAEDEKPIADLLCLSLMGEGYQCTLARDGKEAADRIEEERFDLILLDVMLPEIDGYELLDYIRYDPVPVIFVTAKTEVEDRVRGLKAGAEDYITKPFEIKELLARVEAVLRRYGKKDTIEIPEDIRIDRRSHTVTKEGKEVSLTAKEYELLLYFAENRGRALYRAQIYLAVWGSDFMGDTRTVDLHVQRLRKKLSLEDRLVSVYKIGYRLER